MTTTQREYTQDELEALWQTFQRNEEVDCPNCGSAKVHVELANDPAEDGGGGGAKIEAKCDNCGCEGFYEPGEEGDTYGWID